MLERQTLEDADARLCQRLVPRQVFALERIGTGCVRADQIHTASGKKRWQAWVGDRPNSGELLPSIRLSSLENHLAHARQILSLEQIWGQTRDSKCVQHQAGSNPSFERNLVKFDSSVIVMPRRIDVRSRVGTHADAANVGSCATRDFDWRLVIHWRVANPVWRGVVNRSGNVNHVLQSIPR